MTKPQDDYHGHMTHDDGSHTPLTADQAKELWEGVKRAEAERTARYPDAIAALNGLSDARQALEVHGWREARYCPKDGRTEFAVIEYGSTGIFSATYWGEWPKGSLFVGDYFGHPDGYMWKPINKLTEAERALMDRCVESERQHIDRVCRSMTSGDA